MSIAFQSWEIGSGPTVGYKMQAQPAPVAAAAQGDLNSIPRGITAAFVYRQKQQQQQQYQQQQQQPPQQQQQQDTAPTKSPTVVKFAPVVVTKFATIDESTRLVVVPSSVPPPSGTATVPGLVVVQQEAAAAAVAPTAAPVVVVGGCSIKSNASKSSNSMSSSSSIVTSSISADNTSDEWEDKEVQSAYKGPLEQMDTLMTNLPIRRSLSKFYNGKSRSFASLADVKSIKDLAKPENPYAKRKRFKDGHGGRFPPPRTGGISKKQNSNGTTLTLAVAMSSIESEEHNNSCSSNSSNGSRWQGGSRSLSLTDLRKD